MTSEVAERVLGIDINVSPWPELDPALLTQETATVVVTVDGKMCGRIEVALDIEEDDVVAQALELEGVGRRIVDRTIDRVVVKVPQVVNFVTTPAVEHVGGDIVARPRTATSKPVAELGIAPVESQPPNPGRGR
jgi:hypothetical protein